MSEELKTNFLNSETWLRILYMILYVVIFNILEIVVAAVVLFQVVLTLVTGSRNERARVFGAQLTTYAYQILGYLTYNSEERPFPFGEWPRAAPAVPNKAGSRSTGKAGGGTKPE